MPLDAVKATNSGATNEEILAAIREIQQYDRQIAEVSGARRAALKRWKAGGVAIKPMLDTIRASRRDYEEVQQELRATVHFMALRGIVELSEDGTQTDFLAGLDLRVNDKAQERETEWQADDRGYRDGKSGVAADDNPYLDGTESARTWLKAWHEGAAALAVGLGPNAKAANASRKRPQRAEETEADNVVELDATGQLTGGRPSPKGGKGTGRKGAKEKGAKSAPGRKGSGNRKSANGNGATTLQLTDDRPAGKRRGRPTNAEVAARKAVAEDAGRGDLTESPAAD